MKIVWDEPKRQSNLRDHGYDFADLGDLTGFTAEGAAFFEAAAVEVSKKQRLMAVGTFRDERVAVVYRPLGTEAISVVSMHRMRRRKRDD